jgi:hypothetical protein
MKGLVVWGNHFCRSFGDLTAAILLLVMVLGVSIFQKAKLEGNEVLG